MTACRGQRRGRWPSAYGYTGGTYLHLHVATHRRVVWLLSRRGEQTMMVVRGTDGACRNAVPTSSLFKLTQLRLLLRTTSR